MVVKENRNIRIGKEQIMTKLTKDEARNVAVERLTNEVKTKLANSAYRLVNRLDELTADARMRVYSDSVDFRNAVEGISYIADTLESIGRVANHDVDYLISAYSDESDDIQQSLMENASEPNNN